MAAYDELYDVPSSKLRAHIDSDNSNDDCEENSKYFKSGYSGNMKANSELDLGTATVRTFAYASTAEATLATLKRQRGGMQASIPNNFAQYPDGQFKVTNALMANDKEDGGRRKQKRYFRYHHIPRELESRDMETIMWNCHKGTPRLYKRAFGSPKTTALYVDEIYPSLAELNDKIH